MSYLHLHENVKLITHQTVHGNHRDKIELIKNKLLKLDVEFFCDPASFQTIPFCFIIDLGALYPNEISVDEALLLLKIASHEAQGDEYLFIDTTRMFHWGEKTFLIYVNDFRLFPKVGFSIRDHFSILREDAAAKIDALDEFLDYEIVPIVKSFLKDGDLSRWDYLGIKGSANLARGSVSFITKDVMYSDRFFFENQYMVFNKSGLVIDTTKEPLYINYVLKNSKDALVNTGKYLPNYTMNLIPFDKGFKLEITLQDYLDKV